MKVWFDKFLGQVMTIVTISLILLLSCLPIITLFPTLVALMGVFYFYDSRNEWASRLEAFRYFFKQHVLKSIVCQLFFMAVIIIGKLNLSLANTITNGMGTIISIISILFMCLMSGALANSLFSILINPDDRIREHFRKSLLLVFIKLPQTLLLLGLFSLAGIVISLFPQSVIVIVGLVFWGYVSIEKKIWKELLIISTIERKKLTIIP